MAMDDVLYMVKFNLSAGEAPGEHIAAMRSSANRVVASKHLKQVVDSHNTATPENEMTIISLTRCTQEELDEAVRILRESDPVRVDAADVYPDEKDRNRLIATPRVEGQV